MSITAIPLTMDVHDEMLDINEPHSIDESIQSMHFYEYVPQTNASNNTIGHNIKIDINAQDIYTLPSRSYIAIKGQLRTRNHGAIYALNDEVSLINNAIMYLFTEIRYDIGSVTLEKISSPGQTTTMLTLLSQPDDFSTSAGLKYMRAKDTTEKDRKSVV